MNKVVVIGGDHHNTLGVVESLGQKGIKPFVILYTTYTKCYVPHSKYVESGWNVSSEKDLICCLKENFNDKLFKAVIIATNDIVADIIDRNSSELESICFIPTVTPAGNLADIMSKEYMSKLAKEVGLNVPRTWVIEGKNIPSDIEYPIITKAISSVAGSKDNIRVCNNVNDLKDFLNHQHHCKQIQVQKYIDKEFEFQLLGVSLNAGEDVIIPGRTHIDRPNGLDNTFFLSFDRYETSMQCLVERAVEFVRRTRYTGPFSIEFLRDKVSKNDYFTEMNFRNDGNAYVVTAAGTNLPYIYYLSLTGGDYKEELQMSDIKKTYIVPELYYLTRLLAGEISIKEWLQNMKKANCYTTYFKKDKRVFWRFLAIGAWKRFIPSQN